jgi:hypothetical protein
MSSFWVGFEKQAGFVNKTMGAVYRAGRALPKAMGGGAMGTNARRAVVARTAETASQATAAKATQTANVTAKRGVNAQQVAAKGQIAAANAPLARPSGQPVTSPPPAGGFNRGFRGAALAGGAGLVGGAMLSGGGGEQQSYTQ